MESTCRGPCADHVRSCAASERVSLADISLTGTAADELAMAIIAGGSFTVSASSSVTVGPSPPVATSTAIVLASLGAFSLDDPNRPRAGRASTSAPRPGRSGGTRLQLVEPRRRPASYAGLMWAYTPKVPGPTWAAITAPIS